MASFLATDEKVKNGHEIWSYSKLMINHGKFFKSFKIIFKYCTFFEQKLYFFRTYLDRARESHFPPLPYLPIMASYFYPQGGRCGGV